MKQATHENEIEVIKPGEPINTSMSITQEQQLNPLVAAVLDGRDIDPEKLDKLLAVQERYEANQAKKAYTKAMADFRTEAPAVRKNAYVKYKDTNYRHSTLGYALTAINPILGAHGLNPSWHTGQLDGGIIRVTCRLTHSRGHYEETSLQASPDSSGSKNNIQAIGSTVSYLERYTLFSICGLASSDQDDDGRDGDGGGDSGAAMARINDDQVTVINDLVKETGGDYTTFLRWARISQASDILAVNYDSLVADLKAKVARKAKEEAA